MAPISAAIARRRLARGLALACLAHCTAFAQEVVRNDERLSPRRPEAWAMNYITAPTLMTPFGETLSMARGQWQAAVDLGHVPRLDDEQQRVGFAGTKQEDLNKSPVFGRLRVAVGLPAGFVGELGYTPPVRIRGVRARDLFAAAIGRRLVEAGRWSVSMRAFGQHGRVEGDVTCPADRVGEDLERNPFGCQAPSDDRISLGYYGVDATAAWRADEWTAHATAGLARTELAVQVDALTFDVRDRSRLTARSSRPFFAIGAGRSLGRCWSIAAEVLHMPLRVERELEAGVERDSFTSLRLQLAYRPG